MEIKFYLKVNHSDLCRNYYKNIKKINKLENEILEDKKENNENIKINQSISISNISDKKDFYNYLENYMKNNKDLNLEYKDFIKYSKNFYYNNKISKYFKIDDVFLKNSYYKIKKIYIQLI